MGFATVSLCPRLSGETTGDSHMTHDAFGKRIDTPHTTISDAQAIRNLYSPEMLSGPRGVHPHAIQAGIFSQQIQPRKRRLAAARR